MTEKKEKAPSFTTPAGELVYPKLRTPDTKFKPEGEYSAKLRLPEDEANKLIAKLKPLHDAAVEAGKAEYAELKKAVRDKNPFKVSDFYTPEYDDDEEPTGYFLFNFKMVASGTYKKGPKAGQKWTRKPALFDAKGKPLPKAVEPWGGSTAKVSFEVGSYFTTAAGAGISLRMQAVQVLDLIQGGERSAKSYGFGEEEGYEAPEETDEEGTDEDAGEGSTDTSGENDDF